MNPDAIVAAGLPAWQPNRRAVEVDALHVHDIPLIGTFRVGGASVVFACLAGATSRTSIWAYIELDKSALSALENLDFETSGDLEVWVHEQATPGCKVVFAVARDGDVHNWSVETIEEDEALLDAAVRFMDLEITALESKRGASPDAIRRQAAQARADATLRVLEPA